MLPEVIQSINNFEKLLKKCNELKPILIEKMDRVSEHLIDYSMPINWIRLSIQNGNLNNRTTLTEFTKVLGFFDKHFVGNDMKLLISFTKSCIQAMNLKQQLIEASILHSAGIYGECAKMYIRSEEYVIKQAQQLDENVDLSRYHDKDGLIYFYFNMKKDQLFETIKKRCVRKTFKNMMNLPDDEFLKTIRNQFKPEICTFMSFLNDRVFHYNRKIKTIRKNLTTCVHNQWENIPQNARPIKGDGNPKPLNKLPIETLRDLSERVVKLHYIRQE